ncbi:MAG: MBL fold metallo-hydrolase [Candidatus Aenigmarchaeota archaeon]|nr:MBL fold metallo-hydrolase [Candidatus Aenigmarchaeota archaeon]
MKLNCLGGFREVGKNAVLVEAKKKIMFDYGVKVETGEMPIMPKSVDALVLNHAHLDHVGSAPALYKRQKPDIFSTITTFELGDMILRDSLKIARIEHKKKNFDRKEMERMKKSRVEITYGQNYEGDGYTLEFFNAGHIPGSFCCILEIEGKRIFYTSDFNTDTTRLLKGANIKTKDIDVLIMESTYSNRDHPPRKETDKGFFNAVQDTVSNGGVAVIPSFAIGRAAEVLMTIDSFKPDFPVYLDGMARSATEISLDHPEFIRDPKALRKAFRRARVVDSDIMRKKVIKDPCAIVTTSGLLEGGPSVRYVKSLYNNVESSIIFTGFLIPKTAGRYLVDTGRFVTEGFDLKIKMNIQKFDFSAHTGRDGLFNFVNKMNPEKVVCLHGDYCERFASELRGRGFDAIAPVNGDVVDL